MENSKKCGIYRIVNTSNSKTYIGSSVQILKRWSQHRADLVRNRHHSVYLQRAWNKYGAQSFKFEIIEECERARLLDREQYYMDSLKPEYNTEKIAGKPPQDPERSRQIMKRNREAGLYDNQKTPVERIDPNTGIVKEYASMSDAELEGFEQANISACCRGFKFSHKNYFWKYLDGPEPTVVCEYEKVFYHVYGIHWKDGSRIDLRSHDECNELNFVYRKIWACCNGETGRKSHRGYTWYFTDPDKQRLADANKTPTFFQLYAKPVVQKTLDGVVVNHFKSQAETKTLGFEPRQISACCTGKRQTHKGFRWEFA